MDPTPAEQATLTTLDAIADWVGLAGAATDDETTDCQYRMVAAIHSMD